MRVQVIGGPGTGKTTVGRALADGLGVPLVELDRAIAYRPPASDETVPFGRWERVTWEERLGAARSLAEAPAWVVEGIYAGWTEPLAARADVVIWLDLPGWQAAGGVVRRQRDRRRRGDPDRYPWGDTLRLARRAAIGFRHGPPATTSDLMGRDRANSAATTAAFLVPHTDRVIRCRTRTAAQRAIATVLGTAGP